jgi:hypothetical protein
MEQAFALLRAQARAQGRRLAELAGAVGDGSENMTGWEHPRRSR